MRLVLVPILTLPLLACSQNGQKPPPRSAGTPVAPAGPAVETAQIGSRLLSPAAVQPYFAGSRASGAAAQLASGDHETARAGLQAYLAEVGDADPTMAARARFLLGLAEAGLSRFAEAAGHLEHAAGALPLVTDYALYHAARARYFQRELDRALEHARRVRKDAITAADAELLIGDILRARGDQAAVARHYQAYIDEHPRGIRLDEARFRLAEARAALGGDPRELLALYQHILVNAPLGPWAAEAGVRRDALLAALPPGEQKRLAQLGATELIARGMIYYDAMRNPLAEADFAAALQIPDITTEQRCVAAYHRANSVFKARDRRRAAPLFEEALAVCKRTANADLQVRSAYQAGRCYANIGDHARATTRFAEAESMHPTHSFADDARLRQAEAQEELGADDQVTELLSTLPERYPQGDMRAEATWRLAWRAYKKRDFAGVIRWLEKQIQTVPIDLNWWAEGQAQYWIGRAHGHLGDTAREVAAYRDAVLTYPLSYYALLALNRLRERHPQQFQALLAEIAQVPAGQDPHAPAFRFRDRPEYDQPGFARALEFMRLGLGEAAEAELRRLGFTAPDGKQPVTDADLLDRLWAMAFLFDRAGRYETSHWVARWHVLDYRRSWPVGANQARWLIAYPRAYWDLLSRHAAEHGYPAELLIAFVREESAFSPVRESFANAIGLTQMIFPTAERFARGTGITVSREALRDPEKNVTIGARFLAFLVQRFRGHFALVVPSYNAGEGATDRWLRERGSWAMDEWAEEIPYDETRLYTKRVLGSYFVYSYLKNRSVPEMPNSIPPELIPRR